MTQDSTRSHMGLGRALALNFLGHAPVWYKQTIIAFLVLNPILVFADQTFIAGWCLIIEFIFTLAMALKCYPLQPGGLLAIEAVAIGLTSPDNVYNETLANFPVIMLLIFMVAGIYFMQELLLFTFTKLLIKLRSKMALSFAFCFMSAILSAFLDALTVTAVLITVSLGFYAVYHKVASGKSFNQDGHNHGSDHEIVDYHRGDLDQFRAFLRSLLMHGAIGTALGGVCTLVGEPQNLLIAKTAGWDFVEFFIRMAPVTMPVLAAGLTTCLLLEKLKWFGYGTPIPSAVLEVLQDHAQEEQNRRTQKDLARLIVQAVVAVLLVLSLAFHIAEVGVIGLAIIVLQTAFNGIIDEHQIGKAFEEALPFTALLVVFFAVVAVIHDQHLFSPIINFVLAMEPSQQPGMFYIANGVLSMISDNVFVATVYITEIAKALEEGSITREQFNALAVAINTGTNIPSVATPNGQAAFLFLLTSALAPLIRLDYARMVWMALPYTIVMGLTGYIALTLTISV